jgi:hypothetical protein
MQRAAAFLDGVQARSSAVGESFGARAGSFGSRGVDVQTTRTNLADAQQRISEGEMFPTRERQPAEGRAPPGEAGGNTRTNVEEPEGTAGTRGTNDPEAANVRTGDQTSMRNFDGQRVSSEIDLPGGHTMRVLENGRCIVCTTCQYVSQNYARELGANPDLATRP